MLMVDTMIFFAATH